MTRPAHIVAVCLHPAVDRTIAVPRFAAQPLLRGELLHLEAGGKGINVCHTLSNLGRQVSVTGFVSADEKAFFLRSFRKRLVTSSLVPVASPGRENITLFAQQPLPSGRSAAPARRRLDGSISKHQDVHITAGRLAVTANDIKRLEGILHRQATGGDMHVLML